jgi:hypothetical protein
MCTDIWTYNLTDFSASDVIFTLDFIQPSIPVLIIMQLTIR